MVVHHQTPGANRRSKTASSTPVPAPGPVPASTNPAYNQQTPTRRKRNPASYDNLNQQAPETHAETSGWPKIIDLHNVKMRIYRVCIKNRIYYQVAYYMGGKRIIRTYSDMQEALAQARIIAQQVIQQDTLYQLTPEEQKACLELKRQFAKDNVLFLATLKKLLHMQQLCNHVPLLEAVSEYMSKHPVDYSLDNLLNEYLALKATQNSHTHNNIVRNLLQKLVAELPKNTKKVRQEHILAWLRKKTKICRNHIVLINGFLRYGIKRGFFDPDILIKQTPVSEPAQQTDNILNPNYNG